MSVVKQQANFKRWKRSVSYGYRWLAETAFSSIKRMFGEHVTARKFPNMVKEIFLKGNSIQHIQSNGITIGINELNPNGSCNRAEESFSHSSIFLFEFILIKMCLYHQKDYELHFNSRRQKAQLLDCQDRCILIMDNNYYSHLYFILLPL